MNYCSLSPFFGVLGKKWSTHLLATFSKKQEISFGDLRREFPMITATTLTSRLRDFQNFELIEKTPKGWYSATERLNKLSLILQNIDSAGNFSNI